MKFVQRICMRLVSFLPTSSTVCDALMRNSFWCSNDKNFVKSNIRWKSYTQLQGRSFISFKIHPTICDQKAKINYVSPYKIKEKENRFLTIINILVSRQNSTSIVK